MAGRMTVLGLVAAALLSGCAAYFNYPSIGNDAAINDPNVAPVPTVMTLALRTVLTDHPPEGSYVVNLPEGMGRKQANRIVSDLGTPTAQLATRGTAELPVWHVSRIWIRGDRAEVDVLRPLAGAHQGTTVRMTGGPRPWRVTSTKVWPVGMLDVPELYGWDAASEDVTDAAEESE
jgi:hypothetical protein